jgi:hypothetical protein
MMNSIRDALFGDVSLATWAHGETSVEPWARFTDVQRRLEAGDTAGAATVLQQILAMPDLESRHSLQAWHELRGLGVEPGAEAKTLLGVVVEVALDEGLDLVAAYADHSARYINYSGAAVVWERADRSLDRAIDDLLAAAGVILEQIGPWEGPRPEPPPSGQARLCMLAPGGLFFGQAPLQALMTDSLAGPAMTAATRLMQALIEKAEAARGGTALS